MTRDRINDDQGGIRSDELDALVRSRNCVRRLREAGFVLRPLANRFGDDDGVYGSRVLPGHVDAAVIRGAEYAVAARVRDLFDLADPFCRGEVVWSKFGDVAADVVEELLSRPTR